MKAVVIAVAAIAAILGAAMPFLIHGAALWVIEGALAVILLLIFVIYRNLVRPIGALRTGIELLRAQDFSSRLAKVGNKSADNIGATFNRMMDTLKNERLRTMEQNTFLDMLFDASPMGIVIFEYDGHIRKANAAAVAMLGSRELHGKKMSEIRGAVAESLATMHPGESRTLRMNDARVYRASMLTFLDTGFQRPFLMLECLSEEIRKTEKAAYGKVIRMMAHELNNTVAGTTSTLSALGMVTDDPEFAQALQGCDERLRSLSEFITAYANMVKTPAPDRHPTDVNALIAGVANFLESLAAGTDIEVHTELCPENLTAFLDPVQFEQVLVNIVKNSIESIRSGSGQGTITVQTRPGGIVVTDNGPGISAEAAQNLFTPFFSTKNGGQGIGLMLISEILRNHGYTFSLRTDKDGYTRFTIEF